jgi:tetratricopeptide (TPR) repeat protein
MKLNRVWIVTALIIFGSAFYEMRLKPQSRPLYDSALAFYHQGNYAASLQELQRAYEIEPNSTDTIVLMGWSQIKLRQIDEARKNFSRASRLDPNLAEAKLGLFYVALETGQGENQLAEIRSLMQQNPGNRDLQLAVAVALRQAGQNLEAAAIFQHLLGYIRYRGLARKYLEAMYGLENLNEEIPEGLLPLKRPAGLQMNFRTGSHNIQRRNGNTWGDFYIKGVDIGPARPGKWLSEPPVLVEEYLQWFDQISRLGANTIRVYTVMPPAFYRALQRHNEAPGSPRLYLIQQIQLSVSEDANFLAPEAEAAARKEIDRAIDVIHGHGDLPVRRGYSDGIYPVDVSDSVLGLLIGSELEPHLVSSNNDLNPSANSYSGKYVSVANGNATEVWLATMLDYAAGYEVEKYNQQRPLSIVNWPPLDPLTHPTEAGLLEEMKFRLRLGERVGAVPKVFDDDDAVSVDDSRFRAEGDFEAGLFSSYSVYPYYPEFLLHEPALLAARDRQGPNSYFGYLKALKAYYSRMPLLIVEYGIPTSIGIAHFQPNGWNQGGLNERQQAEILARMSANIAESGCAGGLVFEWQDEWYRSNWMTAPFQIPDDRQNLWLNVLNPQENFGVWTYVPSKSSLFSPDSSSWRQVKPLYEKTGGPPAAAGNDGADAARTLRSLSVSSDEAFVYLRLNVDTLPRGRDGAPQLDRVNYLVGISTRPGYFGSRILPAFVPYVRAPEGVNFLLHVAGVDNTRLLVASNYNPYGFLPVEGIVGRPYLGLRRPWKTALEDWSPFEEIQVGVNRTRFSRDGTQFPPQHYSRSQLRYGPLDPNSPQYDSLATWSADYPTNCLIFRIPWGLLFVTDPSSRQVYGGTLVNGQTVPVGTEGLSFFALSFRPGDTPPSWGRFPSGSLTLTDSLPAMNQDGTLAGVQRYNWEGWDQVELRGRLKAGARQWR